jgi:hypothetical protein
MGLLKTKMENLQTGNRVHLRTLQGTSVYFSIQEEYSSLRLLLKHLTTEPLRSLVPYTQLCTHTQSST